VKGEFPRDGTIDVRVYSAVNHDVLSTQLGVDDLEALSDGIAFDDLVPGLARHLGGQPGFYALQSEYGGFVVYTIVEGHRGSVSLEHSF
jgi:hypothetical protein